MADATQDGTPVLYTTLPIWGPHLFFLQPNSFKAGRGSGGSSEKVETDKDWETSLFYDSGSNFIVPGI